MAPPDLPRLSRAATTRIRRAYRVVTRARPVFGKPPTDWAATEPNPHPPDVLPAFRLFAIVGTWCEADIIEATVRNAFAQGCERVYLVDNDSPDDTVARAEAAGATLLASFSTETYDESRRMQIMNDGVAEVSAATAATDGDDHIWWLWLDADEFHHGPWGLSVRDYLATLDRRFRLVGARFFNHYPDRVPEYVEGHHPLDHEPLCAEWVYPMCRDGHRKHPLQRWDRDAAPITCTDGFHQARCDDGPLLEPAVPIYLHHFPYRVEAVSRRRLELLVGDAAGRAASDPATHWHIHKRFATFDHVYRHHWNRVASVDDQGPRRGVHLRPWSRQVPVADVDCVRF